MPHQTTTLCVNLFAALGAASLFLVLSDTLKTKTSVAFLGITLFVFHPAFQYIVMEGFFGQVIAMGLAVMIFWVHSKLVEPPKTPRHLTRYLILLTCFTSGLFLTYQHMLPFVWIFAGVYSLVLAVHRKTARPVWISVVGHLAACVTAAAISPSRAIAFLAFFRDIATAQAGWSIPFFSPDYLTGLSYQNSPFTVENLHFHLIAAPAVAGIALIWILVAFRYARETTIAIWIGCIVVYVGSFVLALDGEYGQVGGYKSFKFATFFLPFFAASLALLFDIIPLTWQRLSLTLKILVTVSVSAGYVRGDALLFKAMRTGGKRVTAQYSDLFSIDEDNSVQSVNILGPDGWENMWAAYFLMHKKVYCEGPTYYGKMNLEGMYDLVDNTINAPIRHLQGARIPRIRRLNDRFCLIGPIPQQ